MDFFTNLKHCLDDDLCLHGPEIQEPTFSGYIPNFIVLMLQKKARCFLLPVVFEWPFDLPPLRLSK